MKKALLLLSLLIYTLQAEEPEIPFDFQVKKTFSEPMDIDPTSPSQSAPGEQSTLPDFLPKVNVVTGDYMEEDLDFTVAGSEPITIRRFYSHLYPSDNRHGSWRFNPESSLVANFELGGYDIPTFASVGETGGGLTRFQHSSQVQLQDGRVVTQYSIDPQNQDGYSNLGGGPISGQTNPFNTKVLYWKRDDPKNDERFQWEGQIIDGSGTIREFSSPMNEWNKTNKKHRLVAEHYLRLSPTEWTPYVLPINSERRPNGNIVEYQYTRWRDDKLRPKPYLLSAISIYNSSKTKLINQVNFNYDQYQWKLKLEVPVLAEGGVRYYLYKEKINEVASFAVSGSDGRVVSYQNTRTRDFNPACLKEISLPDQHISLDYNNNRLSCVDKGNGRIFTTDYDPSSGKVSTQNAPCGPNGEMVTIAHYTYHSNSTEVIDGEGGKTLYHFDDKQRITATEKFLDGELYYKQVSAWDQRGWLQSQSILDSEGKLFRQTTYTYDDRGNVVEEKMGNEQESYTLYRTFSDDGFNLKLSESDGLGKTTRFNYLPGTNLLASELIYDGDLIKKRAFFTYDDCAICVRKVADDGTSDSSDDLSGITTRNITLIHPKQSHPCFGFPEIVEEKTIDETGQEILLSKVAYSYHPSGQIATEEHYDANNVSRFTIINEYDAQERLIAKTDALGNRATCTYDANNNLVALTGPRADMHKEWVYDLANRPIAEKERLSNGKDLVTSKNYDKLGRVTAQTDICGNATQYLYDTLGRVTMITHPDGAKERKEYDILGNVIKEIDPNGNKTCTEYNYQGKPTIILYSDGSEEQSVYNPNGTLSAHTDKNGAITQHTYDIYDNLIKIEIYSSDGQLLKTTSATYSPFAKLSETNGEGVTTCIIYDFAGRKIGEKVLDREVSFEYDALGRVEKILQGDTYSIAEHDELGRVIEKRTETLDGTITTQVKHKYDSAGNRTHVITSKGTTETIFDTNGAVLQIIDPMGHVTTTQYDYTCFPPIITTTDPKGISTTGKLNSRGRDVENRISNANQQELHREEKWYDDNGNQVKSESHIYQGTTPSHSIVTRWTYGPMNRIEKVVESDQKETSYAYDERGRLQTITKPNKVQIHHEYDDLGRLIRFYSDDIDYYYIYDNNDQLLSVYDFVSHTTTTRTYDGYGNLTSERLANGLTLTNNYDAQGRRTQLTLPDKSAINYTYKAGNLYQVLRKGHCYTYSERDLEGSPTSIDLPNNIGTITIQRDPLSRWKEMSSPSYQSHFPSDAYDSVGNLCSHSCSDNLGNQTNTYTYDDLHQLISENDHSYDHDSLNNRLRKDEHTCTVNDLNQITNDGERDYIYDSNGNLINDGHYIYGYDSLDRLILVKWVYLTIHFTYDPFHRRITKKLYDDSYLPEVTRFLWDGDNEIGASFSKFGSRISELRVLGEGLGAEIGAATLLELYGATYVPIHDHRGSVVSLINIDSGKVTSTYRYTAFGEEQTEHILSPWRFSSKRVDSSTGFIYFGRRYYSPHLGRWITPDPQGFEDGPNLYAYLHNCPLAKIDPYGLWGIRQGFGALSRMAFRGLEWTGANLLPIPYVRNVIESVGRWGAGGGFRDPSRYRSNNNEIITIPGKVVPGESITHSNGMYTNRDEAIKQGKYESQTHGNIQIDVLYQGTNGLVMDLIGCGLSKLGIPNAYNRMCANYYKSHLREDPNHRFTSSVHSRGGIQIMNTGRLLTQDQRKHISVYSYGSATLIPNNYFGYAKNNLSKMDVVTMTNPLAYVMGLMSSKQYNMNFLSPSSHNPFREHGFLEATYAKEVKRRGDEFQDLHFN